MAFTIGLFSLKSGVGVTTTSIHIANFIAGCDKSVAIIESKDNINPIFEKAKTEFDSNGTFIANNVRYYPAACGIIPSEDVIIIDFGEVNILFDFPKNIDKLYLCTDAGSDALLDVQDFLMGSRVTPDILMFSFSKVDLRQFLSAGYKAILIGDKIEPRIDYNLAMAISSVLRKGRINPPEFHKNWEYDKIDFSFEPEVDKQEKKGLFGGRKKKGKIKDDGLYASDNLFEQITETEIEDEESKVGIATLTYSTASHALFEYDFDEMPLPTQALTNENDNKGYVIDEIFNEIDAEIEESANVFEKNETLDTESIKQEDITQTPISRKEQRRIEKEEKQRIAEENKQARLEIKAAKLEERKSKIRAKEEEKRLRAEKIRMIREEKKSKREELKQSKIDAKKSRQMLKNQENEKIITKECNTKPSALDKKIDVVHTLNESRMKKKMFKGTKGILGKLISKADESYDDVANIFIVTKRNRIFVFNNVESFFIKLEPLLRELRDSSNVDYIVITFEREDLDPFIISEKLQQERTNLFTILEALDTDLRREDFCDADFKNHRELQIFDEIIFA